MKWLFHALGRSCESSGELYGYAAMDGHVEICIWLMENGCLLNSHFFNSVVESGNVQLMEWCLQNGGSYNDNTFLYAIYSGKIETLEYLKLNECPWGILSIELARSKYAKRNVLNWLQKNGCPEN